MSVGLLTLHQRKCHAVFEHAHLLLLHLCNPQEAIGMVHLKGFMYKWIMEDLGKTTLSTLCILPAHCCTLNNILSSSSSQTSSSWEAKKRRPFWIGWLVKARNSSSSPTARLALCKCWLSVTHRLHSDSTVLSQCFFTCFLCAETKEWHTWWEKTGETFLT